VFILKWEEQLGTFGAWILIILNSSEVTFHILKLLIYSIIIIIITTKGKECCI